MNLSNKTVIVTGGGTGIGLEIVKAYLDEGANVVLCGRRNKILNESIETLTKTNEKYIGRLFAVKSDMSREKEVINLFKQAKEKFSSIYTLINNAGVWSETSLLQCTTEEIDSMFNNNLKSTILGTKIAGGELEESGSVINIGSFAGVMPINLASLYSTYKAAIIQFTKSAASELAEKNIRVNCVIPGVVRTPMTDDYINRNYDRLIKPISLKRLGTPQEIAAGILFLSAEKASYITGISLEITGGKYLTQL